MNVLDDILVRKRAEVAERKAGERIESLRVRARAAPEPRDFLGALRGGAGGAPPRVIAEFKRASPSRGMIRPQADAAEIARRYAVAGAAALSVLTDGPAFGGSLEDLRRARAAVALPVLRKDFTVDPYQVWEARAAGADAVLLIAAALDDRSLADLQTLAHDLKMAALVEVHDREELLRAGRLGAVLIGINNRDLKTFRVSLETTRELIPFRPPGALLVSESGFSRRIEIDEMRRWGADAFLIGERLMRSDDPGAALAAILGSGERP